MGLVGVDEVEAARAALSGVLRPTGLDAPGFLARATGRPVLLKHEERQRSGSFKLRGAYWRMAGLDPTARAAGVVAASAGNHGQGVAVSASRLGIAATVFMPAAAPLPKVQATRRYGATVRLVEGPLADVLAAARDHAGATGATLIEPFDDPAVIAGQGTVGLEIVDGVDAVDTSEGGDVATRPDPGDEVTVAVPVGGGGLVSGIAVAVRALRPGWRVIGVEAAGAASARAALDAGAPVALPSTETMADGIAVARVGDITYRHLVDLVDDVVTVSDDEIARALLLLLERCKTVVEPAGAAALAAVMEGRVGGDPTGPVCVVLSGGNVDPALLGRLVTHGLNASGRFLTTRVALPDRPGALRSLLDVVAALGLNIVDVEHHRSGTDLPVEQVEVRLTLETRDPDHRDAVLRRLEAAGMHPRPA